MECRDGNSPTIRELQQELKSINRRIEDTACVHEQKIDWRLAKVLEEANLAKHVGNWYRMESDVANLYMFTLAGTVSKRIDSPMVTDNMACEIASVFLNTRRGGMDPDPDCYGFMQLACPYPRPEALHAIEMSDIVEFKEKHAYEITSFRTQIQTLTGEFQGLNDPEEIKVHFNEVKKKISDELEAQRQRLLELHIETCDRFLKVTASSGITALKVAELGHPIVATIAGVGTFTLGSIGWYFKSKGKYAEVKKACPYHYLISLEEEFTRDESAYPPDYPTSKFRSYMHDFAYD